MASKSSSKSTPNKSAATIKVQSQPTSSVVGGSSTAKLAAAKAQQAIEAAAGIKSTVSTALKAGAQQEAASAKKAETPLNKPNVITRSGNAVFQNGKLVANYAETATADASIARMQNATGKGAIIGDNAGTTYRKLYKPAPVAIGAPTVKNALTPDATTDTGSLTVPTGAVGDTSTDANGINRPIASTTAPTAYGQKLGATTPSAATGADSGYYTDKPEAARSLQDIRQEELAQAQSRIDATTALFNSEMQRLTQQGEAALAQTSAYDVGAGLAGSPFQTANENQQKAANTQQYQALSAQRSSDIASIMDKANDDAQTIYQQGLENYRADQSTYIDERDKAAAAASADGKAKKDAATSTISTLAKGGYSIDELPKGQYQELLAASGMSDFEARAVWAAASPEANAKYEVMNGFLVGTYFDPHTGKPVVTTTPLPPELTDTSAAPPDIKTFPLADGSVVMYDAANPYNVDGSFKTIDYKGSDVTKPIDNGITQDTITTADGIFRVSFDEYGNEVNRVLIGEGDTTTDGKIVTSDDISKTDEAKKLSGIVALNTAVDSYKKLIEDGGFGTTLKPGQTQKLKSAVINITTALKAAEALGALDAGVATLVADLIPTAVSEGLFASPFAQGRVLDTLDQVKGQYADKSQALYDLLISRGESVASDPYTQKLAEQLGIIPIEASSGDELDQFLDSVDDLSFSGAASTALNSSVEKLATVAKPGSKGGQCGRFVNNYTGLGVGDSLASKLAKTNPSIKVGQPGDVFVSRYSWTGHTGIIESVRPRTDGTYDYTVLDSNYGLDEKVRRHVINSAKVVGYARVPLKIG